MTLLPRLLRRSVATTATALAAMLAVSGIGAPAGAHGGDGTMEVVTTTRQGDDVFLRIRLTYVADGHGIPDATVTAVVDGATPVPLAAEDQEGLYSGAVPAPAGATVRISSVEPPTSAEVEAPALEEEFPVLPSGPEATATTVPSTTEATTTTTEAAGDEDATVEAGDTGGGDDSSIVPLVVAGVVVTGLVAGLALVLTRKGPGDGDDEGQPVT